MPCQKVLAPEKSAAHAGIKIVDTPVPHQRRIRRFPVGRLAIVLILIGKIQRIAVGSHEIASRYSSMPTLPMSTPFVSRTFQAMRIRPMVMPGTKVQRVTMPMALSPNTLGSTMVSTMDRE